MIEKLQREGDYWVDGQGCYYKTKSEYLQTSILDLCGCGNPDGVMGWICDILTKIEKEEFPVYEDLPVMFFLYWADHKEFVEHGSSIRCCWLTDKGKELLSDIRDLTTEATN
jgi:hypothetical protein